MYAVRVKSGDTWNYSTRTFMEPVRTLKGDLEQLKGFLLTEAQADELYKLLIYQAQSRPFSAIARVEMSVQPTNITERFVLEYREFKG